MAKRSILAGIAALLLAAPLSAQNSDADTLTYADIVGLADTAPLVIHAQVRKQVAVAPERAPGLAPGHVRLFVEARTLALISGSAPLGETLHYLVDVPVGPKGKAPNLKKREFILFARGVPGRPSEIQLVGEGAQQPFSPAFESRLRPVLTSLLAADAPPRVTRVADALAVEGTLVGESETQLFLDTENDGPVSITVVRRPNQPPRWGVSWTEIVDQAARPPAPGTLGWYRLACTLPAELPGAANLSRDPRSRSLAARDYAFVVEQLGRCERTL